jgi:hypothetical protein
MNGDVPLTPFALVATASAFVGFGEDSWNPFAGPQGALVECFLREVQARCDDARVPWDAAFVHHVGYWSHFDHEFERSAWPLPATASVEELAQFAGTSGALREAPLLGDVFLLASPAGREFVRTGIVAHVERFSRLSKGEHGYKCVTIEGHSAEEQTETGTMVLRVERTFSPALGDRFIRWTAFDERDERREGIELALDEKALWGAA